MRKMHKIKAEALQDILNSLPPEQQLLVQTCIDAAKHHNKKSRRYKTEWIYECLIMRIKAPGLYNKLMEENKIASPSPRTLQRYMTALRPAFGFQENVFSMMANKAAHMPKAERHGKVISGTVNLNTFFYFFNNVRLILF